MNKERLDSLNKYLKALNDKISGGIPEKHKERPQEYKEFLTREITKTKMAIDSIVKA